MAVTNEPVAVLGIGAMGHGMAASALRAGIPAIVWNALGSERDRRPRRARRAGRRVRGRRGAAAPRSWSRW